MSERSVAIGRDAQGNAIVTGSNNLTFVFFGMEQVPADLVEALQSGRLRPADALGAVPLPALTLTIELADDGHRRRLQHSTFPDSIYGKMLTLPETTA